MKTFISNFSNVINFNADMADSFVAPKMSLSLQTQWEYRHRT